MRIHGHATALAALTALLFAATTAPAAAAEDNRCADSTVCVTVDALNPAPVPEPAPEDEPEWPGYHMPDLW